MTKDFQEMVDRLAMANNFKGGAYCLITAFSDQGQHRIDIKGLNTGVICGVDSVTKEYLTNLPDDVAKDFRRMLIDTLLDDALRRSKRRLKHLFKRGAEEARDGE